MLRASDLLRCLGALCCCAVLGACGGPQLDRLVGEPPAADKYTLPVERRTHPAIDGVQRFIAAMQRGETEKAWSQLSVETRKALHARAQTAGTFGIELLRIGRMPVGASMQDAVPMDYLRLFAVRGVTTLQALPTPEGTPPEQRVELTGQDGTRVLTLRFEGYAWRLHQPELAMPELKP